MSIYQDMPHLGRVSYTEIKQCMFTQLVHLGCCTLGIHKTALRYKSNTQFSL